MELFLFALFAAFIFAFAVTAVLFRLWRKTDARPAQHENETTLLRAQLKSETENRAAAENAGNDWRYKCEAAQAAETAAKVESGKTATEAETAQRRAETLHAENARLQQTAKDNAARIAELETKLQNAQTAADEKIALLEKAQKTMNAEFERTREQMGAEFKNLSQNILDEKSKKFGEENAKLLAPLRESLEDFRKQAGEVRIEDAKDRSALKQEILNLQNNAAEYGKSADNLARALKGDSKIQGGWGEIALANLLEKSGLREGEEYETQKSVRGEDNKILRPDVVVNLPDGKHLIVDSKVSLRDFCDAAAAENPETEKAALSRHAGAVKNHVAGLAGKHYARAKGVNAPDFVFMFMEIEPAFFAALKESPELFSDAYDKKIILCAPTTLMATLRTVERIWQMEKQNRNAEEIARRGGLLYDKFYGFVQDMAGVNEALKKTRASFDAATAKLKTGPGNLIGQAQKLHDMGVDTKKPRLPDGEEELPAAKVAADEGGEKES